MKKIIILMFGVAIATFCYSQNTPKLDDFGRIVLNTYLPEKIELPTEAKNLLETKLSQIASNYGMGGSTVNPRFIITANVNVGTKDIIAGPPQMIAQNLDVTLFIGDAVENKSFCNTTISLKGVGTNGNKAYIDALKKINPKNPEIQKFVEEGKNKIVTYYNTQCDFIIKNALTLKNQGNFDEAIYQLSIVPDVCRECYFRCLDTLNSIFQQKVDADCNQKLKQAKTLWAAEQTPDGAEKAADIVNQINPLATCQPEVDAFIKSIEAKLKADEQARWQFKLKQYADKVAMQKEQVRIAEAKSIRDDQYRENQSQRNADLDKIRINANREISIEYAKNQPKTVTYNNIYWR